MLSHHSRTTQGGMPSRDAAGSPAGAAASPVAPAPIGSLRVGAVGDRAEVDADRRADEVVDRLTEHSETGSSTDLPHRAAPGVARSTGGPRGAIGPAGGLLGAQEEQRIEARRGRGDRLPDEVRRSFETAFGRSFAGVTVHRDTEADSLNGKLSATAFTTGDDIYFSRGAYRPGDAAGDRLLAHELAHVEQGSRDPHRTIRRRIGFEFETNIPAQENNERRSAFAKGTVLKQYDGFRMETDINEFGSTIEFVVHPPLPDTGRDTLDRIMTEMVADATRIQNHGDDGAARAAQTRQLAEQRAAAKTHAAARARLQGRPTTEIADLTGPTPNPQQQATHSLAQLGISGTTEAGTRARVAPDRRMTGNPQATAGIALERLSTVQGQVGAGGSDQRGSVPLDQRPTAESLNSGVTRSPASCAAAAREALRRRPQFVGMTAATPGSALKGIVTVLLSYLEQGQRVGAISSRPRPPLTYAKLIAGSMMMRTDLGSMVRRLPAAERDEVAANAGHFADWVLDLAGYPGGGAVPVFERGFLRDFTKGPESSVDSGPIAQITRRQWLEAVAQGNDLLSAATHHADTLEGLGALGNTVEPVIGHTDGVIVEFRGMARNLILDRWRPTALATFDYLRNINGPDVPAAPPPEPLEAVDRPPMALTIHPDPSVATG